MNVLRLIKSNIRNMRNRNQNANIENDWKTTKQFENVAKNLKKKWLKFEKNEKCVVREKHSMHM